MPKEVKISEWKLKVFFPFYTIYFSFYALARKFPWIDRNSREFAISTYYILVGSSCLVLINLLEIYKEVHLVKLIHGIDKSGILFVSSILAILIILSFFLFEGGKKEYEELIVKRFDSYSRLSKIKLEAFVVLYLTGIIYLLSNTTFPLAT